MRRLRTLVAGLALALLAACAKPAPQEDQIARPALWLAQKGPDKAWLLGTVHLIPEGAHWDGGKLGDAIAGSQRLIVETTGIENPEAIGRTFAAMGHSDGVPAPARYLTAKQADALHALVPALPDGTEPWAIALLLNAELDKRLPVPPGEGVDQGLIRRFRDRGATIAGLESVEEQLAAFDTLPMAVQTKLLATSIDQADEAPDAFIAMYRDWARGDIDRLGKSLAAELSDVAELRGLLLTERNRAWDKRIDALIAPPGTELIAVGAAHLIGPDSLIALMQKRGWTVRRVQ